jgi:hypothetical protein
MDDDTRLSHSKGPISINQSYNNKRERIILSYAILCVLDVNNISCQHINFEKVQITLSKIISSRDISIKSQGH